MIYFIIGIIIVTIISYYYIKDITKFIRFMGITTIISGYIMIIFNRFLKNIIDNVTYINVSKITNIVFDKAKDRGLILILIGCIQLIIYIIIVGLEIYKNEKKQIINQ